VHDLDRGHLAWSDCERVRPGFIAQPVNTWSSLAYCVAGAWIIARGPIASRVPSPVLGGMAVVAGVGSVAYHGPGGLPAHVAHDAGAYGLGATMAATAVTARRWPHRPVLAAAAVVTAVAGVAVHHRSRTDRPWCRPDARLQGHAAWHVLGAIGTLLLAESLRVPAPVPAPDPAAATPAPDSTARAAGPGDGERDPASADPGSPAGS